MPPADMPMNARIPALALDNPGKGQIKKATDADVKLMALAVAETPTLNDAQFKQQWIENFDTRPTVTTRQWGDVKFVDGKAVLTSTDVTPENTTVKGANDWQAAGLMVPPTGAATGNGYGLYTIIARTDTEEAPGPFACLWPATDRWPGPELDIFEKASRNDYDGYSTIHFKSASGGDGYTVYRYPAGKINMSEFHEYALEWAADHISLYIDKQLIYTTTINVPKSYADGGENSAFGVGMKPDWAWGSKTARPTSSMSSP